MPDPRPLSGLYGKVPAHGDFVRRGLPTSFVGPWDAWLAAGIAAARARLGAQWEAAWDSAPAWRFALPAGMCGPDAVAGVMLPSQDQVGRRFPITLAALLAPNEAPPAADWFDALEAAALAGRAGAADADALCAAVPPPGLPVLSPHFALPAVLPGRPDEDAAAHDAAWAPSAPAFPDAVAPGPDDVLALLGGGAALDDAGDDALAFLSGAPPAAAGGDGSLMDLIAAAPPAPAGMPGVPGLSEAAAPWPARPPEASAAAPDDVLVGLIGAGAHEPPAADDPLAPAPTAGGPQPRPAPAFAATTPAADGSPAGPVAPAAMPADGDGTLIGLIGAAAPVAPDGAPPEDGVLAGLIGPAAGAQPMPQADSAGAIGRIPPDDAPASLAGLPGADPGGPPAEWPDLLPGAALPVVEAAAEAAPATGIAQAPPAPEGGGWWTRGGAHVPPLVWPLPGLPDPADFAYLLEAAA